MLLKGFSLSPCWLIPLTPSPLPLPYFTRPTPPKPKANPTLTTPCWHVLQELDDLLPDLAISQCGVVWLNPHVKLVALKDHVHIWQRLQAIEERHRGGRGEGGGKESDGGGGLYKDGA